MYNSFISKKASFHEIQLADFSLASLELCELQSIFLNRGENIVDLCIHFKNSIFFIVWI